MEVGLPNDLQVDFEGGVDTDIVELFVLEALCEQLFLVRCQRR